MLYKINAFSEKRKRGIYNSPKHREKTLDIARESIVLLKNEKNVLPLKDKTIKTLAVIGENANIIHSNGGGSAEIKALYEVTPLLGIKSRLGGQTEVKYAKGYDADRSKKEVLINEAVELAKTSDAVIIIGGLKHNADDLELENNALIVSKDQEIKRYVDSEGYDKTDLDLPYAQDELIKRVLEVNKNAVIVMLSGAPIKMTEWIDDAATVVQTWYNGMEGGNALAEVLFGDVNPSGKLPVTFPKALEDSPAHKIGEFPGGKTVKYTEGIYVGYRYFASFGVEPLFCFGHGLSYTEFKYEGLDISINEAAEDVDIAVKFNVTNTGDRDGAEVPQIYVRDLEASVERPRIELKGFDKIYLKAGETKEAEIKLNKKSLAFYNVEDKKWTVEAGCFEILIGSSSEDIRLKKEFNLNSNYKF